MFNYYQRLPNTKVDRTAFSEADKLAVWRTGQIIPGYEHLAHEWRKDACGALMRYADHGNTKSEYGWEIDHKMPVAHGGSDFMFNLQPLQWQNNRAKGDTVGAWYCKVGG